MLRVARRAVARAYSDGGDGVAEGDHGEDRARVAVRRQGHRGERRGRDERDVEDARRRRRRPGRGRRRRPRSARSCRRRSSSPGPRCRGRTRRRQQRLGEEHDEHRLGHRRQREADDDPGRRADPQCVTSGVTTAARKKPAPDAANTPARPDSPAVDVGRVVEVGPEQQDRGDGRDAVEEAVRADRGQRVPGGPVVPHVLGAVDQPAGHPAYGGPGLRAARRSRSGPSRSRSIRAASAADSR